MRSSWYPCGWWLSYRVLPLLGKEVMIRTQRSDAAAPFDNPRKLCEELRGEYALELPDAAYDLVGSSCCMLCLLACVGCMMCLHAVIVCLGCLHAVVMYCVAAVSASTDSGPLQSH